MTTECVRLVAVPLDSQTQELVADIEAAAARARKADPAERSDVTRFEALSVQLEQHAARTAACEGAESLALTEAFADDLPGFILPSSPAAVTAELPREMRAAVEAWLHSRMLVVSLRLPLEIGDALAASEEVAAPPPAERWESPDGARGRRAVEQRFRSQIDEVLVLSAFEPDGARAISPSGLENPVVTEILREYVDNDSGGSRVDAPVEYRDGSKAAHAFPLRSLRMSDRISPKPDVELRLALLSVRHTEMDPVVHGAWLRNAEISRPRPAAQTDDIVFEASRIQLLELTERGKRTVLLHLYHTGLETAVVGFYRALAAHLADHPGSVTVVPMYAQRHPKPRRRGEKTPVVQRRAPFRTGTPWGTA